MWNYLDWLYFELDGQYCLRNNRSIFSRFYGYERWSCSLWINFVIVFECWVLPNSFFPSRSFWWESFLVFAIAWNCYHVWFQARFKTTTFGESWVYRGQCYDPFNYGSMHSPLHNELPSFWKNRKYFCKLSETSILRQIDRNVHFSSFQMGLFWYADLDFVHSILILFTQTS